MSADYFQALQEGMYFVPQFMEPLAANLVIVLELVLVWLLFSRRNGVRWAALGSFFLFHVYSTVYVGYTYPSLVLPVVAILFAQYVPKPTRVSWGGVMILVFLALWHAVPYLISGPALITYEGAKYGVYMFEANYQCRSTARIEREGGHEDVRSRSTFANHRCDPYAHFFYLKQFCTRDATILRIPWQFDTSLNGGSLMRIVDVEDACALRYSAFVHNEWIRVPSKDTIQYFEAPAKNRYGWPLGSDVY